MIDYDALATNIFANVKRIKSNIYNVFDLIKTSIDINNLDVNKNIVFSKDEQNSTNLINCLSSFVHKVKFIYADKHEEHRNYTITFGFPKNTDNYTWDKTVDYVNSTFIPDEIIISEVELESNYDIEIDPNNTYFVIDNDIIDIKQINRANENPLKVSISRVNNLIKTPEEIISLDNSYIISKGNSQFNIIGNKDNSADMIKVSINKIESLAELNKIKNLTK